MHASVHSEGPPSSKERILFFQPLPLLLLFCQHDTISVHSFRIRFFIENTEVKGQTTPTPEKARTFPVHLSIHTTSV